MDRGFKRNMRINSGGNMAATLPFLGFFLVTLGLVGCSGGGFSNLIGDEPQAIETLQDGVNRVTGGRDFAGIISADEPQAVLAARDILERGGNAVDAATALYFSLAVTYDGAASLGGGGVCVIKPTTNQAVQTVSFVTEIPTQGGEIAVPGNARGFAYMHAQYGSWGWKSLIEPGAHLASLGYQVSKAMHTQWGAGRDVIAADEWLRRRYQRAEGKMISIGREADNVALATSLGIIGARGPEPIYAGDLALTYIDNANKQGGKLTLADLRGYRVKVSDAARVVSGDITYHLPSGGSDEADSVRQAWATAGSNPVTSEAAGGAGSTSFYVVDRAGQAISCALTQNDVFGSGSGSEETGIVFSKAGGTPAQLLVPVIGTNASGDLAYVGASAGSLQVTNIHAQLANAVQPVNGGSLSEQYMTLVTPPNEPINVLACANGWVKDVSSCQFAISGDSGGLVMDARKR